MILGLVNVAHSPTFCLVPVDVHVHFGFDFFIAIFPPEKMQEK